jgi:hypothetical protein
LDYFIAYHRGDRSAFEVVLSNPVSGAASFQRALVTSDAMSQ